ncbi:hypothetical protein FIV37_29705 [Pseudomonas gessardii]|nr:hypothetical protein [Pseudomonas gessardii]
MDGRSRRAHGAMPDCGHAEPRRGTEWWGKSVLLTLALFKVSRRKGGTLSGRNRSNGYVHTPQEPRKSLCRYLCHKPRVYRSGGKCCTPCSGSS